MGKPDVSLVLLCAFFCHAACLTDVDGPVFTWDLVDIRSFQTKALFDLPENAACLGQWKLYYFNVSLQ
jgi:hypothetical protein